MPPQERARGFQEQLPEGWVVEEETGGLHADNRRAVEDTPTLGVRIEWDRGRVWGTRLEPAPLRDYQWAEETQEFDTLGEAVDWVLEWGIA